VTMMIPTTATTTTATTANRTASTTNRKKKGKNARVNHLFTLNTDSDAESVSARRKSWRKKEKKAPPLRNNSFYYLKEDLQALGLQLHTIPIDELCIKVSTDIEDGLSTKMATQRLLLDGTNELSMPLKRKHRRLHKQTKLSYFKVDVIRDGVADHIPNIEIVVGDLVILRAGDEVPADLRIIECVHHCTIQRFGQAEVMECTTQATHESIHRSQNMAYFKDIIREGEAAGIVVATGDDTVYGQSVKSHHETVSAKSDLPKASNAVMHALSKKWVLAKSRSGTGALGHINALVVDCTGVIAYDHFDVEHIMVDWKIYDTTNLPHNSLAFQNLFKAIVLCNKSKFDKFHNTPKKKVHQVGLTSLEERAQAIAELETTGGTSTDIGLLRFYETYIPNPFPDFDTYIKERERFPKVFEIPYTNLTKYTVTIHSYNKEGPHHGHHGHHGHGFRHFIHQFSHKEERKKTREKHKQEIKKKRKQTMESKGEVTFLVIVRGAPEKIFPLCDCILSDGQMVPLPEDHHKNEELLNDIFSSFYEGFHSHPEMVIAVAQKTLRAKKYPQDHDFDNDDDLIHNMGSLCFLGLVSLEVTMRREVARTVAKFKQEGIQIVMCSTFHPLITELVCKKAFLITGYTALDIAKQLGVSVDDIDEYEHHQPEAIVLHGENLGDMNLEELQEIFDTYMEVHVARILPHEKEMIVNALKAKNLVVAVTGTDFTDSKAIKKADCGIALYSANDVVKHDSDLILLQDDHALKIIWDAYELVSQAHEKQTSCITH